MKTKFTEEEYKKAKSNDLLKLECEKCGKEFLVSKVLITQEMKHSRGRCRYCSLECSNNAHKREHHLHCLKCGKEIVVKDKYYKKSENKHFFCSTECANQYNNPRKNIVKVDGVKAKSFISALTDEDFKKIISDSKSYVEATRKMGYVTSNSNANKYIDEKSKELGIILPFKRTNVKGDRDIKNKTKGELKEIKKTYQQYRNAIRKDAEKTFQEHFSNPKCVICGYDKHIEIAHIKAVSEFSNKDKISIINDISNIIPLCPNHHWEFDNNMLSIEDKKEIDKYMVNNAEE